jgi:hypothetical protein
MTNEEMILDALADDYEGVTQIAVICVISRDQPIYVAEADQIAKYDKQGRRQNNHQ